MAINFGSQWGPPAEYVGCSAGTLGQLEIVTHLCHTDGTYNGQMDFLRFWLIQIFYENL